MELLLPGGRVSPLLTREKRDFEMQTRSIYGGKLVPALPAIPSIGSAPVREFPVKVGQLIDGIGSADLFVGRLPEPREPLFEQLKYRLDKGPRQAILFGHKITSIVSVVNERQIRNSAQTQPKRLSCTGTAVAGQGVFLISVLTGSTKWMLPRSDDVLATAKSGKSRSEPLSCKSGGGG